MLIVGTGAIRQYPYDPGPLVEPTTRLALVTQDPEEAHRSPVELAVLGAPAAICAALAEAVDARPGTVAPAAHAARTAAAPQPGEPLRAGHVLAALAERLPRDAILLEETPSSRPELHARIPATAPLGFISAMGMLGFALPAAIGVRMARPDRPVLAVVGDGSSLYQIQALWSAAAYDAGVLFIVLRNGGYAIMNRLAERAGSDGPWPALDAIDIAAMARAQGCEARRIETHADLLATLDELLPALQGPPEPAAARDRRRSGRDVRPLIHRLEHGVRAQGRARQHRRHAALVKHDDPVAQRSQLVDVGRADQHRRARLGRRADQRVHLGLGADVHAARRIVEQDDRRRRVQPLGEHDLLLVAAGERVPASLIDRARCGSAARAICSRARRRSTPRAHDRPVRGQPDRADLADVLPDRLVQHQARAAGGRRSRARRRPGSRAAARAATVRAGGQHDSPAVGSPQPADQLEHRVVTGAGDARQPDDLAARDGAGRTRQSRPSTATPRNSQARRRRLRRASATWAASSASARPPRPPPAPVTRSARMSIG